MPAEKRNEQLRVDLSKPDNSEYVRGRSTFVWSLWYALGDPLFTSRWLPFPALKCALLRLFGAKVGVRVHMKSGVRVKFPWYLSIGDNCWIGEDVWIDNLDQVDIGANVCVSQGAYLCTGNHDWKSHNLKLFRRPICLRDGCWVGARAVVCPGITINEAAIITVGSVVTSQVPPFEIWAGNPARCVGMREIIR